MIEPRMSVKMVVVGLGKRVKRTIVLIISRSLGIEWQCCLKNLEKGCIMMPAVEALKPM